MRFIRFVCSVLAASGAVFVLSACSDQGADSAAVPTFDQSKYSASLSGEPVYTDSDGRVQCHPNDDMFTLKVPVSAPEGGDFSLIEVRNGDFQESVKVHAQLPVGVTVPALIVHTVGSTTQGVQRFATPSGLVDTELKTAEYTLAPGNYHAHPISAVTFCFRRAAAR